MTQNNHIDGLLECWVLDGKGSGRQIEWNEVKDFEPNEKEWLWIHMDYSFPEVQSWMRESSGLVELAVEALLQSETRPRSVYFDDALLIFLRGVNLNPGANPDDMVSIRLWINPHKIISLGSRSLLSLQNLVQSIKRGDGPGTQGGFVIQLLDGVLNDASDAVDNLYSLVDSVEESVLKVTSSSQHEELANARRQAISIRRYLAPQRDAISRLITGNSTVLQDDHKLQLKEDLDRLTRIIEDLDALSERATIIHELLLSSIAEQTNKRTYILSIIAAIFLPLSFVTGLFGINVGGIPGTENIYAFTIITVILVITACGLWLYFRSRDWY